MAFELNAVAALPVRAKAFTQVSRQVTRDLLGAVLLTKGDYSRDVGWKGEKRQLGSSQKDDSWTDMLTTGSRTNLANIREPLMSLLDDFAERSAASAYGPSKVLDLIRAEWLVERESQNRYDWRYYLVRYVGARSSKGDGYYNGAYDATGGGFSCGRLRMLHGSNYNAYFSDALLRAAWYEGGLDDVAEEPTWWHRDDPGLTLTASRVEIRCVDNGFEFVIPEGDDSSHTAVGQALKGFNAAEADDGKWRVLVQQDEESAVDAQDRIQLCVRLVHALASQGL
jgi:hypothetical protein